MLRYDGGNDGNPGNHLANTPSGGTTYTFSANGDETAAGAKTFSYDLADRMTSAVISGTTTTYAYGGDGNRLSAVTGSTTTNYRWDVNRPLRLLATEANGSGTTEASGVPWRLWSALGSVESVCWKPHAEERGGAACRGAIQPSSAARFWTCWQQDGASPRSPRTWGSAAPASTTGASRNGSTAGSCRV
jgi:hypothetical protein